MARYESNSNDLSNPTPLNILEYITLFWRWAWLIILVAAIAGAGTYFYSKRITPIYQTTTRLLVSNPPSGGAVDASGMIPLSSMVNTYSQMTTDTPILENVIKVLGLKISPDILRNAISTQVITNTQILSITVSDTSPTRAAQIANTLFTEFSNRISGIQQARYASTLGDLKTQMTDISNEIDDTNTQLMQAKAQSSPDANLVDQLNNRLTTYNQLYSNLVTSVTQINLATAQTSTTVTQIQPAAVPTSPISPKILQDTLLSIILAALLAAGVILVFDLLDDTIKNPDDIRRKFGLPILGVIAQHNQVEGRPITQNQPRAPVSESFRALRTNITYAAVDNPLRWIMVTSPTPQDGKTTVCTNLGVVFAQSGKKAVVVDGDMRRPMEADRFGLTNANGLSDLFLNPLNSLNGAVQETTIPGLRVVTSGAIPPNPAELMASKRMLDIFELLSAGNDLVIVDTPPVLSVTDAVALAPGMDGVILIAKPGVTKNTAFRQAVDQLRGVGAKILGVVLNDVEPRSRKYGYYYDRYYSKYSYYYTPEGKKKKKSNPASTEK